MSILTLYEGLHPVNVTSCNDMARKRQNAQRTRASWSYFGFDKSIHPLN